MNQPAERRAFSHKAIFAALAISLTLGLGAGIFILTRFATYEPKALQRIPEDAHFVARLNVQQAVVHAPLVRSLLPVFERGRAGSESRAKHLERKTTLELNVDVRELIFAELDQSSWLLLAGGFLRSDEVLEGVARMLDDEGVQYSPQDRLIVSESGVTFCVAEDGTLALAQRKADAKRACGPPGAFPSWAAGLSGAGVALSVHAAERERVSRAADAPSHLLGGDFLVDADSHFPARAELKLRGVSWTEGQLVQLMQSKSNDFSYLLPLSRLSEVKEVGPRFRVQGNLSREEFDASVARLASLIESALDEAGGPGPTQLE